jgi:site-specific DNA-methyltransferase (adenine-specific)
VTLVYEDDNVHLYHGDCREFNATLDPDVTIADVPYNQTSLPWDRWPTGWLSARGLGRSLWCFGSLRLFMARAGEFADEGWRLSQDVVWEKHNGSNSARDRFRRVHEQAALFYRGDWKSLYKAVVTTPDAVKKQVRRKRRPPHWGEIGEHVYVSEDGGPRLQRSVIRARSCHGSADHETQKPFEIIAPLIEYSCPPSGVVYVPFAGSGSELEAARQLGRCAIGIEIDEAKCLKAAKRLAERRGRQWSLGLPKACEETVMVDRLG